MSSIITNNAAMSALQTLRGINQNMSDVQNQINSGKHIGSAKDNAAIWSIAATMETDVTGFQAVSESLNLGNSTLEVARKGTETIKEQLEELKGSIVTAQTPGVDRLKVQQAVEQKVGQIMTVVESASFNGVSMLQGSDDVAFLASLNRDANGSVTTSNIVVQQQDLTTKVAKFGTADGTAVNIAATDMAATATDGVGKIQIAADATGDGVLSATIAGVQITTEIASGATQDQITAAFAAAVNNNEELQDLGVSAAGATGTAGDIDFTTTNKFTNLTIENAASTAAAAVASIDDANLERRSSDVDLTSTAVQEGHGYRITVNSNNFDYVAKKGDTMVDVAKGFEQMINGSKAMKEQGVDAKLDLSTGNPKIMIGGKDGAALASLAVASNTGADDQALGEAQGGLRGLESLDVTTEAGAKAALGMVEGLIQNALSASSAIGAAQERMDSQTTFVKDVKDGLTSGVGALVDADMEEVSARLQALQVQQQLGVQALSIANQQPQSVLSLFR